MVSPSGLSHWNFTLSCWLHSIYNMVVSRSSKLLLSALKSKSPVLIDVFTHSSSLAFTSLGFNKLFGDRYIKSYSDQDYISALDSSGT